MRYYRVHLPTMTADFTPLPGYLIGFSRAELADLTWIQPDFENGYLVGYAWWPEVVANRQPAMYERMVGTPTLTANAASKVVYATYAIEDWSAEEIAQDKRFKHIDAIAMTARLIEQKGNELSVTYGFDGATPMLTAISYMASSLPLEALRGTTIFQWRDAARAITNALCADVLVTGVRLFEDTVYAALPPWPEVPNLPAPVEPPADPVDPPAEQPEETTPPAEEPVQSET